MVLSEFSTCVVEPQIFMPYGVVRQSCAVPRRWTSCDSEMAAAIQLRASNWSMMRAIHSACLT
jgi:hypothetical protein